MPDFRSNIKRALDKAHDVEIVAWNEYIRAKNAYDVDRFDDVLHEAYIKAREDYKKVCDDYSRLRERYSVEYQENQNRLSYP